MAQMNTSNTLFNDTSTGEIAYVEQLKDRLLRTYIANNPNYSATDKGRIPASLKADIGVFQEKLNEFFLDHWVDFQRFLLDEGVDPTVIDSWKEVQEFLEGLPDDETMWLKNKLTALDTAIAGIDQNGIGTFDVSAYNNEGGVYAQYADLAAALAGVPITSRRSGMAIRFIDSDTQQYEMWEYKKEYANTTVGNEAFITVSNWYGFQNTDAEPTAGSAKPVQSGGVQNELALGAVYDVSAKNPTAGLNSDGKWESLSALLSDANLNTLIPTAVRKGGMSIKFVLSSDNKYVQFRFMLSTFTAAQFTNTANWQGVDEKLMLGSENVAKSGEVFYDLGLLKEEKATLTDINFFNKNDIISGKYITNTGDVSDYESGIISNLIPIRSGKTYFLKRSESGIPSGFWGVRFLAFDGKSKLKPLNESEEEYSSYIVSADLVVKAPQNAYYIQFQVGSQLDLNQLELGTEFTHYHAFGGHVTFNELPQELSEENIELFVKKDKYSINLYDSSKDIIGYYISSNGSISLASGYSISSRIPVEPNTKYHLHNVMASPYIRTVRFLDASGQKIEPIDGDGNTLTSYTYNSTDITLWTTEQTRYIQFTVETPGGHSSYVQLEQGVTYTGYKPYELIEKINFDDLPNNIHDTVEEVYGEETQASLSATVLNKYVDSYGKLQEYGSLKLALFDVVKNGTYLITIPKATNAAGFIMSYMHTANDEYAEPITEYGMGDSYNHFYNFTPTRSAYLAVGYDGNVVPTCVLVRESFDSIVGDLNLLKGCPNSILYGKSIMLFGDSLTAASTTGVKGFGELISETLQIPYRKFVYDSADNNKKDIPMWIPNLTNYAKDGTHNAKVSGRPADSILERVKRHVTMDANVDYVLVECSVNDTAATMGEISDSFTGPFDEYLTIPAIEETCRYLTTLGKPIRIGFYIPWKIVYVADDFFNPYAAVFAKWGVPLLDMRNMAGFNFRNCSAHRALYSLSSASYSTYDNTTTYNLDDKVKYGGVLYKCNADGVVGIPPTNATYWTEITEGSYDGCHLNSLGHYVVAGKIMKFIESL